ncbi:MAG: hypothetical protein PHU98_06420 [Mariniphaga sp.]|nr:hypothetical protein [Paludibacter sp.]MDD4226006.1 hypothetical protein [Mariniphaga sp.]
MTKKLKIDKKTIYESEIVEIIKKYNLYCIKDIFAFYTGIKSSQFYNLELEKSERIKKAIDDNKRKTCQSLKNKWYKSDNPTLQIALFKCICSEEEKRSLAQNYTDITNSDGSMKPQPQIILASEKDLENQKRLLEKFK